MSEQPTNRIPHLPAHAWQTAALIEKLRTGKVGDELTDAELATVVRGSTAPGGKSYGHLSAAIRYVIRVHGVVWQRIVKGNRIRCLDPLERVGRVESERAKVHRATRRALRIGATVSADQLPADQRPQFVSAMIQLGTLEVFSRTEARKRLEEKGTAETPSLKALLDAIK